MMYRNNSPFGGVESLLLGCEFVLVGLLANQPFLPNPATLTIRIP